MKCQSIFWVNKKNISKCCLLKLLPSMVSVKSGKTYCLYSCYDYEVILEGCYLAVGKE